MSVRLRGRPWVAVLSDMIEGVIAANRLVAPQADRLRGDLWLLCGASAEAESDETAPMTRVA